MLFENAMFPSMVTFDDTAYTPPVGMTAEGRTEHV